MIVIEHLNEQLALEYLGKIMWNIRKFENLKKICKNLENMQKSENYSKIRKTVRNPKNIGE